MQESHNEGVASHIGPESWRFGREVVSQALTGERMDWVLSLENRIVRSADGFTSHGRQHLPGRYGKVRPDSAWSKTPATYQHTSREWHQVTLLGASNGSFTEAGRSPGSTSTGVGVRIVNPRGTRR